MIDNDALSTRLKNGPYLSVGDMVKFREDSLILIKSIVPDGCVGEVVGTHETHDGVRKCTVRFSGENFAEQFSAIHASELELHGTTGS